MPTNIYNTTFIFKRYTHLSIHLSKGVYLHVEDLLRENFVSKCIIIGACMSLRDVLL